MKINQGENWMAVALCATNKDGAKIDLYNLDSNENAFPDSYPIDMLNSDIEFIDFSTDDCYLVYKDFSGEVTYVDISDKSNIKPHINPNDVEFTHEWI